MSENLDSEQRNRLWEHRLFAENLLYSRLNFFLIFESVLLAVVGALYSKTGQSTLVLKVIILAFNLWCPRPGSTGMDFPSVLSVMNNFSEKVNFIWSVADLILGLLPLIFADGRSA